MAMEMDSVFNVYLSLGKRKKCLVNTSLKPIKLSSGCFSKGDQHRPFEISVGQIWATLT